MSFSVCGVNTDPNTLYEEEFFSELVNNLSSRWNGRQVALEDAITLHDAIQDTLMRFISSQGPEHPSCKKILDTFTAWVNPSANNTLAHRDVERLVITPDVLALATQAGLKDLWREHKKAIIIAAAAVVVIATVVIITIATYGTGTQAASAAGAAVVAGAQACLDHSEKEITPHPVESSSKEDLNPIAVSPPMTSPPNTSTPPAYKGPLFLEDGVMVDDKHYFYWEFLQQSKKEEFLSDFLNAPTPSLSKEESDSPPYRPIPPKPGVSLTRKFFEVLGRDVAGSELMVDTPPSNLQTSHLFTTPGQRRSSCRIGGINGINTSVDYAAGHAHYLNELSSGQSIDWVYNNSHGALADAFVEVPLNYSGISPNTANLLKENWVAFHEENKDNLKAKHLQLCHSQGAIHVKNALIHAPREIRDRLIVVAIAPAAVVPDDLCFRSFNYASKKDIVPFAEFFFAGFNEPEIRKELFEQALEDRKQLILLDPHPEATGMNHDFRSPTFREFIQERIKAHMKNKGEYEYIFNMYFIIHCF